MPQYIIHKDGAYNIFSTIVDAPFFEPALTLKELEDWMRKEYGEEGIRTLPERLERVHRKGTSSRMDDSLEECVSYNRAGEKEACVPFDEFVQRFLTLPLQHGEKIYHKQRDQHGTFLNYDEHRTEINDTCWVEIDGEELHVTVDQVVRA
jgi:hypothetical protein